MWNFTISDIILKRCDGLRRHSALKRAALPRHASLYLFYFEA